MSRKSAVRLASLLLALIALSMAAVPAAAQGRPFHVEANVGIASIDDLEGLAIDESATAFRLGTGYRFLPWLGVSGAFVNLGSIGTTVDVGIGGPQTVEASADGFEVTLTGHVPLTDSLSLTAHAGMLWWTGDTNVAGVRDSDSGNDSTWGVGAEYAFGPTFAVTAGWRRYAVDSIDADAAWLGMMIRFGDAP